MIFLDVLNNNYVRGILVFLVGITIGAIFYPTKKIEEKISQKYEQQISQMKTEFQSYKSLSEDKITSLTSQVTELNTHQKIVYIKITKPDGTVEEHQTTENDTQRSDKTTTQTQEDKINQIQTEFASKEKSYKDTISSLEKSKTISVNQKRFSLEIGALTDQAYYAHANMDVWGPVFIGIHGESRFQSGDPTDNRLGVGIGIRF